MTEQGAYSGEGVTAEEEQTDEKRGGRDLVCLSTRQTLIGSVSMVRRTF